MGTHILSLSLWDLSVENNHSYVWLLWFPLVAMADKYILLTASGELMLK